MNFLKMFIIRAEITMKHYQFSVSAPVRDDQIRSTPQVWFGSTSMGFGSQY